MAVSGQNPSQFEANPARGVGHQSRPLFRPEFLHEAHLREDVVQRVSEASPGCSNYGSVHGCLGGCSIQRVILAGSGCRFLNDLASPAARLPNWSVRYITYIDGRHTCPLSDHSCRVGTAVPAFLGTPWRA
jgi:hypothetical protein